MPPPLATVLPVRLGWAVVLVGVGAALAAAAGVPARATYGARVTADEPQYLLTAISLAEDHDLDISDELRQERWRPFHEALLPQQSEVQRDGSELSPHDPLLPAILAVPVALGGWIGAKLAIAVIAGILAGLLVWVAVRRFAVPVRPAAVAVGQVRPRRRRARRARAVARARSARRRTRPCCRRSPRGHGRRLPHVPSPRLRGLDRVRGREPLRRRGADGGWRAPSILGAVVSSAGTADGQDLRAGGVGTGVHPHGGRLGRAGAAAPPRMAGLGPPRGGRLAHRDVRRSHDARRVVAGAAGGRRAPSARARDRLVGRAGGAGGPLARRARRARRAGRRDLGLGARRRPADAAPSRRRRCPRCGPRPGGVANDPARLPPPVGRDLGPPPGMAGGRGLRCCCRLVLTRREIQ